MDKLIAYSDDEEETTSIVEEKQKETPEDARIPKDTQMDTNETQRVATQHDSVSTNGGGGGGSSKIKEEGIQSTSKDNSAEASTSSTVQEKSYLRHLAPVPKILRAHADPRNGEGSTSKNVIDAEWGLGLEKPRTGNIDEALFTKLSHFQSLKEEQGTHFNQSLAKNRSFRNPHIYSKLVQWVEVEETSSGYADMIKGKEKVNEVWMSSKEARAKLKAQGGKDAIATLQKRRQEESDEKKRKNRRENIDFVGSTKTMSSSSPSQSSYSNARMKSEAFTLAEKRAQKIRDDMAARNSHGSAGIRSERDRDDERERQRRKDREEDRSRSHRHHR